MMRKGEINEIQKVIEKTLGEDWDVKETTIQKIDGYKDGIGCRYKDDDFVIAIYPDMCEELLDSGVSIQDVGEYLAQEAVENRFGCPEIPKTPEQFRQFKDGLFVQVISADISQGQLKNIVHDSMSDIAIIARCKVASNEKGVYSFIVNKNNMELFQMTQSEIMEQAYKNTAAQKFCLQNLREVMMEQMVSDGMSQDIAEMLVKEGESPLYVLSNPERVNGANAIVCPEVLHEAFEELGEAYYIMPSSTHELLLVKESEGLTPDVLKDMVYEVNTSEVRREDLLSFNVFHYDGRKLTVAKDEVLDVSEAKEKVKKVIR